MRAAVGRVRAPGADVGGPQAALLADASWRFRPLCPAAAGRPSVALWAGFGKPPTSALDAFPTKGPRLNQAWLPAGLRLRGAAGLRSLRPSLLTQHSKSHLH
jgi:hypothetical protein